MTTTRRYFWRARYYPQPSLTLYLLRGRLKRCRFSWWPGRQRIALLWMQYHGLCRDQLLRQYNFTGRINMRARLKPSPRRY